MDEVTQKPKGGRPATGRDPLVTVRLPQDLIDRIERWRNGFDGMSHSIALRCLIDLGLRNKVPKRLYDPKNPFGKFTPAPEFKRKTAERKHTELRLPADLEPPKTYKPRHPARKLSAGEIAAAVARAEGRSKGG